MRLWKTVIPPVKIRGENVLLECQYELNNSSTNNQYNNHNHRQQYRKNNYLYYDNNEEEEESLYSVKWYKDNEEFYRFVPKANPPQHSYKFDGIKVDVRYIFSFIINLFSFFLYSSVIPVKLYIFVFGIFLFCFPFLITLKFQEALWKRAFEKCQHKFYKCLFCFVFIFFSA